MSNAGVIYLADSPIGWGQERACYVHPDDPSKAIKVQLGEGDKQTRRELDYYSRLSKRPEVSYAQLPRFYGLANTNLGQGFIVDLVRDYNGEVSRPVRYYLEQGCSLVDFEPFLQSLKSYFLDNTIIFSNDMSHLNLLFQRLSPAHAQLVIIDGIGDHTYIKVLNSVPCLARRKINRRWARFEKNISSAAENIAKNALQQGVAAKRLDDFLG